MTEADRAPVRQISLSALLSFTIALIAVSVTAVLVLIGSVTIRESIEEQTGRQLMLSAQQAGAQFDRFIWTRHSEFEVLRELIEAREFAPDEASTIFLLIQEHLPMFAWIGLLDSDGRILAESPDQGGVESRAGEPVFREGRDGSYIDAVAVDGSRRRVEMSAPVTLAGNDSHGVLAATISSRSINEIRDEILGSESTLQRDLAVIQSEDGMYIVGSSDRLGAAASSRVAQEARASDGFHVSPGPRPIIYGFAVSKGYREFEGLGWITVVSEPVSSALGGLQQQRRSLWLTGILIALVSSVVGFLSSRTLTRSLRNLQRQSEAIRLGGREVYSSLSRVREFDVLGESLDYLARELSRSETAAHRDNLTGLLNRLGSVDWFTQAVATCRRYGWTMIIMAIDLDGFKTINDTFGHFAGDAILKQVAKRLRDTIRPDELSARWGGDEFVVCVYAREPNGESIGEAVADRILASVQEPVPFEGQGLTVGCSIGMARCDPGEDSSWQTAHERADKALYKAKSHGKNQWAWD
ncbi:MAG: diguanylate cyclase domain-containing protein [Spirochaetaceae bacterium]